MASLPSLEPKVTVDGPAASDLETTRATARTRRLDPWSAVRRVLPPVAIGVAGLLAWELVVRLKQIPYYILPGPLLVIGTLEPLDEDRRIDDLMRMLHDTVVEANHRIADAVKQRRDLEGMGTTLTALRFVASRR